MQSSVRRVQRVDTLAASRAMTRTSRDSQLSPGTFYRHGIPHGKEASLLTDRVQIDTREATGEYARLPTGCFATSLNARKMIAGNAQMQSTKRT
ncbi:hypothetical protein HN011_004635 [Eciton burchellii]|nr:hypothetical protein HN011_004635 [Eciton burchellii]